MADLLRNYRLIRKGLAAITLMKQEGIEVDEIVLKFAFIKIVKIVIVLLVLFCEVYFLLLLISPIFIIAYLMLAVKSFYAYYKGNIATKRYVLMKYNKQKTQLDIFGKAQFLKNLIVTEPDILEIHTEKIELDKKIFIELRQLSLNISDDEMNIIEEFYKLKQNGTHRLINLTPTEATELDKIYNEVISSFQRFAVNGRFKSKWRK